MESLWGDPVPISDLRERGAYLAAPLPPLEEPSTPSSMKSLSLHISQLRRRLFQSSQMFHLGALLTSDSFSLPGGVMGRTSASLRP